MREKKAILSITVTPLLLLLAAWVYHVDWDTVNRTLVKCVIQCGVLGEIDFLRGEANCKNPNIIV